MKAQLNEIWDDLRDRRLWPVAAVLVLALIAAPMLLVSPAEEVPSQAVAPSAAPGSPRDPLAQEAVLKVFNSDPLVRVSTLDQFASEDPFKPIEQLKPLADNNKSLLAPVGAAGASSGAAPGGAGGAFGGGGDTGATPGGGLPGAGGSPGGAPGGGGDPEKPGKKYTYAVDLTFGEGDDGERYKAFDRLGMLPSEAAPLLVFLGVDATGGRATFLVDSTLDATGDGVCRPSANNCGVLYMEPGEEEAFSDGGGKSYTLTIDKIRKVVVDKRSADISRAKARARARKSNGGQTPRRFLLPTLIDLETRG